jgi:hypothetical protein
MPKKLALGVLEDRHLDVIGTDLKLSGPIALIGKQRLSLGDSSAVAVGNIHDHQHLCEDRVPVVSDVGEILRAWRTIVIHSDQQASSLDPFCRLCIVLLSH